MARAINGVELAVDAVCGIALMALWLWLADAKAVAAPAAFFGGAFCGLEILANLVRGRGAPYALATAAATGAGMAACAILRAVFAG